MKQNLQQILKSALLLNFDPKCKFFWNAMSDFHESLKIWYFGLIYTQLDIKIIATNQKRRSLMDFRPKSTLITKRRYSVTRRKEEEEEESHGMLMTWIQSQDPLHAICLPTTLMPWAYHAFTQRICDYQSIPAYHDVIGPYSQTTFSANHWLNHTLNAL